MSRYSTQTKVSSPSIAIEDSKKKTSLLKDNSWIRKLDDEDEPVDRDPNFGRSVLGRYKPNETVTSTSTGQVEVKTTKPAGTSSVTALTKRFTTQQDEPTSPLLSTKSPTSYTKRYSGVKTETPTSSTSSTEKTTTTSVKTTTVITDDGTTKTTKTTQSVTSPVTKSGTKTETFTERVRSSSKGSQYSSYSPTKTTLGTEKTVITTQQAEDDLYDSLIPSSIKKEPSTESSKTTVTTTNTVTVKSSTDTKAEDYLFNTLQPGSITSDVSSPVKSSVTKLTNTTVESSKDAEDKLYDSLIPMAIKSDVPDSKSTVVSSDNGDVKTLTNGDYTKTTTTTRTSSTTQDDPFDILLPKYTSSDSSSPLRSSTIKRESSNGGESSPVTSPSSSSYTHSSYSSYSDDIPSTRTSLYSRSYSRPESRPVLEKDLCTSCRKPFTGDAKIVLDDMKINCHAGCFKCTVCNTSLGHLKAGDSMWIYKRAVHCESCFESSRVKWRS